MKEYKKKIIHSKQNIRITDQRLFSFEKTNKIQANNDN